MQPAPVPSAPANSFAENIVSVVKAIPGTVAAAASAMTDGDLLRRAAAAMAMQPNIVKSVTATIGSSVQGD
jgi:hypothetical protein